jgi:hypothetical protein
MGSLDISSPCRPGFMTLYAVVFATVFTLRPSPRRGLTKADDECGPRSASLLTCLGCKGIGDDILQDTAPRIIDGSLLALAEPFHGSVIYGFGV